jgi:hypothetical protein
MIDWAEPSGEFPELKVPDEVLAAFPPDRDGLIEAVCPLVTDTMLRVIAESDYGEQFKEHLAGLKKIRAGMDLDQPIGWTPNEVLSLFRWSEGGEDPVLRDAEAFHIALAFCCCALARVADVPGNRTPFENDVFAPLIESCLLLGEPFRQSLIRLLTWSLQNMDPWEEDYLFLAFGLFASLALTDAPDPDLVPLVASWLLRANRQILPWHSTRTLRDARTFLDMDASVTPKVWARLALVLEERLQPSGELADFLGHLSQSRSASRGCRRRNLNQTSDEVRAALKDSPSLSDAVKRLWELRMRRSQ